MERVVVAAWWTLISVSIVGFAAAGSDPSNEVWYLAVAGLCTVGALVSVLYRSPARRGAWLLLCGALACDFLGDLSYWLIDRYTTGEVPQPSVCDVFFLLTYPLLALGLLGLARSNRSDDRSGIIDSVILGLGFLAVVWDFALADYLAKADVGLADRIVGFAYPAFDVIVFLVAIRVTVRLDRRQPAAWMLFLGTAALVVADLRYTVLTTADAYLPGHAVDALWLAFYCCLALAAGTANLHKVLPGPPLDERRLSKVRFLVIVATMLLVPTLDLVMTERPGVHLSRTLGMFIVLMVVGRLYSLVNSVERANHEIEVGATHDPLTGLTNRVAFTEQISARLDKLSGARVVMFVNLSDFKAINDTMGHRYGDLVLAEVAERVRTVFPDGLVSRFGGDEFAATFDVPLDTTEPEYAARRWCAERANAVLDVINRDFEIDGLTLSLNVSIGSAVSTNQHPDPTELLRSADIALYQAKRRGPGSHDIFEESYYATRVDEIQLRLDLQHSIRRSQLRLMYQPIIDIQRNRVSSVEALIRWDHPTRGLVSPLEFIPLAEQSGYIVEVGRWALETAAAQLRSWQTNVPGAARLGVSVNVSGRQLEPEFVGLVDRVVRSNQLRPSDLLLEVTESVPIVGGEDVLTILRRLRELGVRLGVDDFGTGYSSLSFLHHFPIDVIKIDRSLVTDLETSERAFAIFQTVRDLTDAVEAVNVAEGVEVRSQVDLLRNAGCQLLQGYYFAPPLTPAAFVQFFTDFTRDHTPKPDVSPREVSQRDVFDAQVGDHHAASPTR